MQLPTEIYDLITLHVEIDQDTGTQYGYQHWQHGTRHYNELDEKARQRLANLRLVNKAFYGSVSPRLFRHLVVDTNPSTRSSVLRLEKISKSKNAEFVRGVGFRFWFFSQADADQEYVKDLTRLIRPCLLRFNNLRALVLRRSLSTIPNVDTWFFASSIVEMFRGTSFPNLEELTIQFPLAHDFGAFFQPSSSSQSQILPVMSIPLQNLRYLELWVYLYAEDSGHQRLGSAPLTDETYESYLYQIINPAIKLQYLSIRKSDYLHLDSVDFSPLLPHLRYLNLTFAYVSADKLLTLFIVPDDEYALPELRHIQFQWVKLVAGTWHSVLLGMSRLLPRLVDFKSMHSGYSPTGSSAHLVPEHPYGPFGDDDYSIETNEAMDIAALGHLQRVVNGNRVKAGLEAYTKDNFEYIEEPPLELMQQIRFDLNIS